MLPNANSPVCLLPMSCQHSRDIFRENMYRISTASQNCTMSPCRLLPNGRHVCPYFRRLHVAVEPFCPSYQDQRSVGPDPLQYVQCHFHQRVAGNRIQFGTGIEGHKGNCRPRSPVRLHLRVGRVVARRKQYDEQCRVDIRAVHGLDIPHTVCPL